MDTGSNYIEAKASEPSINDYGVDLGSGNSVVLLLCLGTKMKIKASKIYNSMGLLLWKTKYLQSLESL